MLNKIFIMGRLTRDPELRHTQSGTAVATMALAVERDFKDKASGEKATDFINVVAWRQTGEFAAKYFTKGRMAIVEGRLQTRDWTDKEGNKRRAFEVIADQIYFGDSKREDSGGYASGGQAPGDQAGAYAPPASGFKTGPQEWEEMKDGEDDGELPF